MKQLIHKIRHIIHSYQILQHVHKRFPGTTLEANITIKGNINNLKLGRGVIIQSGTVLHLGGMAWCQNTGYLEIGDDSVISPNCILYAAGSGGIRIGKGFDCGPSCGIFASRTDYKKGPGHHIFAPVIIGNSVILYTNVVISPGVTIGDRSAIAAGSVVTKDIPNRMLVGGAPARIIAELH